MKKTEHAIKKLSDEFVRMVLFLKDDEKILAVFPFYHNMSTVEYNSVINTFYNEESDLIPLKNEFCLMYEEEFGWGWIHDKMIVYLNVATKEEYEPFKNILISNKHIRNDFILNEE